MAPYVLYDGCYATSTSTSIKDVYGLLKRTNSTDNLTYIAKKYAKCIKYTTNSSYFNDYYCGNYVATTSSLINCSHRSEWSTWFDVPPEPTISEKFRRILQSRQAPSLFIPSRKPIQTTDAEREIRARQTLRRILGNDKFQRFLRNGFVSIQAKSGKVYQIYPGHGMTIVYDRGVPVEKLCVVLRGDFTPTDSLITRYVMILHSEEQFKALAHVWGATQRSQVARSVDMRPLPQILQSLKAAA